MNKLCATWEKDVFVPLLHALFSLCAFPCVTDFEYVTSYSQARLTKGATTE
jgi:hypothetical protein